MTIIERRSSLTMSAKICGTLLPIGVILLPLGVLGVPLGTGTDRQELLQEKVCYYQVPPTVITNFLNFLSGGK